MSASGGIGRMNSTIGSRKPRQNVERPMAKPTGMPMMQPVMTPSMTRLTLIQTCSHSATFR